MAVPTNTIQAVGRVGVREDLSDRIGELFPDDTPFCKMIGRESASQVYHEWQTDKLAAASATNAAIQGDDLANGARENTVRQGNYTQIFTKVVGSSTTMEASRTAGRRSELAREIMKAGRELATDKEMRFCGNYAATPPTASVAGLAAGAQAFIVTNDNRGTGGTPAGADPTYSGGGTSGYPNAAAVNNSTTRAYTEALLKDVMQKAWVQGGNPKAVITSMALKATASAFAGIAQHRREAGNSMVTIVAGADVYVGDAGTVQFVPSRFTDGRSALVIDPEYWAIANLHGLQTRDLAVTGLATRKALVEECTLVCRNEAASGVVADLA